jgi:7-carboxy-7-deazaguanine synthase
VSLKLANSGVPEPRQINPEAIRDCRARGAWWRVVVTDPSDVAKVLQLRKRFALPRDRILLMPEGIQREEILERSLWVVEECRRHGFRYSPRLHILLWGAKRGV